MALTGRGNRGVLRVPCGGIAAGAGLRVRPPVLCADQSTTFADRRWWVLPVNWRRSG